MWYGVPQYALGAAFAAFVCAPCVMWSEQGLVLWPVSEQCPTAVTPWGVSCMYVSGQTLCLGPCRVSAVVCLNALSLGAQSQGFKKTLNPVHGWTQCMGGLSAWVHSVHGWTQCMGVA
jgi:hypothetical protein